MRVARIEVNWGFLLRALSGHELTKVVTDIPDDARVLAAYIDESRQMVVLHVESTTFDDVPELNNIPQFYPKMTVSVTEISMLADLVSKRHDAWMEGRCATCDNPWIVHSCPS